MAYNDANRMIDPTIRASDYTRQSDHTQLLGNQEHFDEEFAVAHDPDTGAHEDQHVPDLAGYATRVGLGVNPVPLADNEFTVQLIHPTTATVTHGWFHRLDVGDNLDGVYEAQLVFGGDRKWAAYTLIERIGTE